jgi:prevent-host-death family protein
MILTRQVRIAMSIPKRKKPSSKRPHLEPAFVQKEWQLQEAKARFSEVFRLARESGPQRVTKHGRAAVIVLPAEDYERLSRPKMPRGSLVRFFAESPLSGSGIQLDRPRDFGRAVKL